MRFSSEYKGRGLILLEYPVPLERVDGARFVVMPVYGVDLEIGSDRPWNIPSGSQHFEAEGRFENYLLFNNLRDAMDTPFPAADPQPPHKSRREIRNYPPSGFELPAYRPAKQIDSDPTRLAIER